MFGQRSLLNKKELSYVLCGELLVCSSIHSEGGRDIHQAEFLNTLGMVEAQAVRHTGAAIMSGDQEVLVTIMSHHTDLILRHGAK